MHPIICELGPFKIYSYGFTLAAAFLLSSWLVVRQARKQGLPADTIFNLAFIGLISGILGARLFYVAENIGYYLHNPIEIIMLQNGGLSWFGGLFLGSASVIVYARIKKLVLYEVLDLFAPFVALAQGLGRIGCFLNGCCFGRAYFLPVQIYSALLLIMIFIILKYMQNQYHKSGQIFFTYLFLYSIKRFFIEFWRTDNSIVFHGLTLFQLLSIALFLISSVKLFLIYKSPK